MSPDEKNSGSAPDTPQSEIDALIEAFEDKTRSTRAPRTSTEAPDTLDPLAGGHSEPISVVALSAAASGISDMEALIAQVGVEPVPADDAAEPSLDRAFEELSSVAAETVELLPSIEASPVASLQRDDANEILADAASDSELTESMEAPIASGAIDEEIIAPDIEDAEAPEVEPDGMDEVLAAVSDAASEPAEESAVADTSEIDAAADEEAGLPPAAPVVDTVTQTSVIEEIGSENVAAGAAPEFTAKKPEDVAAQAEAPASALPASPKKKSAETAPAADVATEAASKKGFLPPPILAIVLAQPARAAAAIGLGVFVGVLSFAFLLNNPLRPYVPPADGEVPAELGLERAVRMAQAFIDQRDYAAALALINKALEHAAPSDEHRADALFLRAEALVRSAPMRLTAAAADTLHTAIDDAVEAGHEDPRTAEALMWKAEVYEREGNIPAARAELRGILDSYPASPARDAVIMAMAELDFRTGQIEEALDGSERLLHEHPDSSLAARARILQGDIYSARGNPAAARAVYILATAEHPDTHQAMAAGERLGKLALQSGNPQAAIEELERRLDTATTVEGNDAIYLVLAQAYRAIGQPEKARNILNELFNFFPESEVTPVAMVELSEVLEELGLTAEAGRMADRATQRFPANPDVLRHAGTLLARRGEPLGAAEKLMAAYDAGAHEPVLLLDAGNYLLEAGETKQAQTVFARLAEEHGGSPESLEGQIGWAQAARALGDIEGAFVRLDDLSRANDGSPAQLPVLRALADLYRELGLEGEMIETYGKVAGITDEPALLAEASEALIEAGAADEGLQVAQRVDVARLGAPQAYNFLNHWGRTLLRRAPDDALALLMRAHEQYTEQRTAEGVQVTLQAALTLGRSAQARALVADLQARAQGVDRAEERAIFERAAVQYGNFLFQRGDYTAAEEAYAMLIPKAEFALAEDADEPEATAAQEWAAYQRANSLYALDQTAEALRAYDAVVAAASPYAREAQARADLMRFQLRRNGQPDPTAPAEETS